MSKIKTAAELTAHKEKSLNKLESHIDNLIASKDSANHGRADKLCYWISDYVNFLNKEKTFDPKKSIKYKRGDIVKIHLGYRVGSEEGGLHFAVVMDVNNAKSSNTLTVIPLTSIKPGKTLHINNVSLGSEVFKSIIGKHDKLHNKISEQQNKIDKEIEALSKKIFPNKEDRQKMADLNREIKEFSNALKELKEIRNSILKMKSGSIALVNQITTISKIRIYDPVYTDNVLYGVRLSAATMKLIDDKVQELFLPISSK